MASARSVGDIHVHVRLIAAVRVSRPPATHKPRQLRPRLLRRCHLIGAGRVASLRQPLGPAAASHGGVKNKGDEGADGRDPDKDHHLDADLGLDVELVLGREGELGREADGGGDDSGDADEDGGDEGDDGDGQGEPPGADDERGGEHEAEVYDGAGREEGVHDAGADSEELQDGVDLGGQGDGGAGEQLRHQHLYRVEPVEGLGFRAKRDAPVIMLVTFTCLFFSRLSSFFLPMPPEPTKGNRPTLSTGHTPYSVLPSLLLLGFYSLIVVALTEIPKPNLVKVVQTQTPGHRIEELRVGDGDGYDLGDVKLEEVYVVEDAVDVGVADGDEDKERQGEEVEDAAGEGRVAASIRRSSHRRQEAGGRPRPRVWDMISPLLCFPC